MADASRGAAASCASRPAPGCSCAATPSGSRRRVGNLLANAIEHGGRRGSSCARRATGERVRVEVRDDGPGLPAPVAVAHPRARAAGAGGGGEGSRSPPTSPRATAAASPPRRRRRRAPRPRAAGRAPPTGDPRSPARPPGRETRRERGAAPRRALVLAGLSLLLGGLAASDVAGREAALEQRLGPTRVGRRHARAASRRATGSTRPPRGPARARRASPRGAFAGARRGRRPAAPRRRPPRGRRRHRRRARRPRGAAGRRAGGRGGAGGGGRRGRARRTPSCPGARVDVLVTREPRPGAPGGTDLALEDVEVLAAGPAAADSGAAARGRLAAGTLRQAVYLAAAQSFARELRLLPRAHGRPPPRRRALSYGARPGLIVHSCARPLSRLRLGDRQHRSIPMNLRPLLIMLAAGLALVAPVASADAATKRTKFPTITKIDPLNARDRRDDDDHRPGVRAGQEPQHGRLQARPAARDLRQGAHRHDAASCRSPSPRSCGRSSASRTAPTSRRSSASASSPRRFGKRYTALDLVADDRAGAPAGAAPARARARRPPPVPALGLRRRQGRSTTSITTTTTTT